MAQTLVKGDVVLPYGTEHFSGATLHVSLIDRGMMDAGAQVVSNQVIRNVDYNGAAIAFSLEGQMPDNTDHLNVRAHLSRSGGADINKGDFITKEAIPVLQDGKSATVTLSLEEV